MILRTPRIGVSALFALLGGLFGVWLSRIPSLADRFGLDHDALGLLFLVLAVGAIVAFPFAGVIVDRIGAARVARTAIVGTGLGLCLVALAPTIPLLALALFLTGLMNGGTDVSINAWAAEVERASGRPVMNAIHAFFPVGAGLGALSGSLAAQAGISYAVHFVLVVAIAVPPLVWLASIPRARAVSRPGAKEQKGPGFALPPPSLWLVGLLIFCSALGEGGMADWGSLLAMESTGVGEGIAALGYTAFSLAMIAARFLGDRLVSAVGPIVTARVSASIAAMGVLIAVFSPVFPLTVVGFVLMGIGFAPLFPLAVTRAGNDPAVPPGAAIAGIASFGYGGLLLGPPILGFVAEATSLPFAFGLLSGIALIVAVAARSLQVVSSETT